jgi:hypothetical protein
VRYTHRLTITIPAALYDVACAIARSLDPDTGGADSFGSREQGDPPAVPDTYTTTTPCTAEFSAQAQAMAGNPAVLHHVVSADYADRWADLTPPTLADCAAFCAGAVLAVTGDAE